MAKKLPTRSIGQLLQQHRVKVLKINARQAAKLLGISQPMLSYLENDEQPLSEERIKRVHEVYGIPEAVLRAGSAKPDAIVREVASQDAVAAEIVPEILRLAKGFNKSQWQKLRDQTRRIQDEGAKP